MANEIRIRNKDIPDQSLAFLQYKFTDMHGEEIDMKEEIEIK